MENQSKETTKSQKQEVEIRSLLKRLNFPKDSLYNCLLHYYEKEVRMRGREFVWSKEIESNMSAFTEMLCDTTNVFGVMLVGTIGNGKSTMAKAFLEACQFLERQGRWPFINDNVKRIHARRLVELYIERKEKFYEYENCNFLIIDDFGTEPFEIINYGAKFYPMYDLIESRYDNYKFTIITSNLTNEMIEQKYVERMNDRLLEMFPINRRIVFTDSSYRHE